MHKYCSSSLDIFTTQFYVHKCIQFGAWPRTLRAADQKYLESFEMWCWRRMEKISWTDHVRNEDLLLRVNEQRNILHEIRKRKANWIGHILRRNCLLKEVMEGKMKGEMEVTRRRGRRRRKPLDDLKDRRGYSHLKEEVLDRTMWRNRFTGGFGPVVRQNTEWMNECRVTHINLRTALFWVTTQPVVVISYRRFGTICRTYPQGLISRTLRMGPIDCPETTVRNYHYSLRNNPEERSSQLIRGGSLKSSIVSLFNAFIITLLSNFIFLQ